MTIQLSCTMPPQRRIAIVGKAPTSLNLAPYPDPTWQIWTLSDLVLCRQSPRYDVQFEMHDPELVKQRPPYWEWLCRIREKPVFMLDAYPEVPASVAYPIAEIKALYGEYFTNSASYMIALAIACEPEEIGVWGIDMATSEEYRVQRPSCEYFLGIAAGKGIRVTVAPQADLLKTAGLYGYNPHLAAMAAKRKARMDELQGRLNQAEAKRDQAAMEAAYLQGALEDTREYWGQWCHGS